MACRGLPWPGERLRKGADDVAVSLRIKRRVSLGLVLSEVVKVNELHAKSDQVKAIVEESAESYEHPEEVVRWYYAQPQRLAEIEGVAIEDNVVAWALATAKVIDKPVAFDELMGQKS